MPITRATNLAGLGTVFDALTDGGGLSISGVSTFTDLNITRANVTGVSTLSSAIVGSAVTITSGGIVAGLSTVNSINATHINATGVGTFTGAIVGSAVTITSGGIVAGLGTVNSINATHINATGIGTFATAIVGSAVTITAGGIVAGLGTVNSINATHINSTGIGTFATAIVGSAVTIASGGIVAGLSTVNYINATHVNISGVTTVSAGSVAAPSITPTGDSNTGIFFPAADTIAFGEGGAEALRIDSSGRVGIGTTNPSYKLTVAGGAHVRQTLTLGSTSGNGGFLKTLDEGLHAGELVFDNGSYYDTPGLHWYFGNYTNYGIDAAFSISGGGYLVSGNPNLRFVYNINESGGTVHAGMNSEGKFFAREFVGINTLGSDIKIQKLNEGPIGFKNLFYNPAFIVDERHDGIVSSYNVGSAVTYTVDRWCAASSGSVVTANRTFSGAISTHSPYGMVFTGSASNSFVDFTQRLESAETKILSGRTITISCDVMNTAGITTMSIIGSVPTTSENTFTSVSVIFDRSVTIGSSLSRVSTTVSGISTDVFKGFQVTFRIYGLTSGKVQYERPQLEIGPVASEWEIHNTAYEVSRCARYCQKYGGGRIAVGNWSTATSAYVTLFPNSSFRATPTLHYYQAGKCLVEAVAWYNVTFGSVSIIESSYRVVSFHLATIANSGQSANANALWGNGAEVVLTSEL